MPRKRRVLIALGLGLAALTAVLGRPAAHLIFTASKDRDEREKLPPGYIDDASRLNQTKVAEIWQIPVDSKEPEKQIAELLARAKEGGQRVSIAGARHSMGGHTIYPDGILIDTLPWNRMSLDESNNLLTVQSGALWKDVIVYLDQYDRSVAVMQSNNSFSVGGSISVNCHGWQYNRSPIASTVESFRLMQADGSIVQCSREQNRELFSLVLGGYGLFGIILDAKVHVVANETYRLDQYLVPTSEALATLDTKISGLPGVQLVYARLNIAPDAFLEEVVINAFVSDPGAETPELSEPGMNSLKRSILRGSAGNDYGKELRWSAETKVQPWLADKQFSRNQLLNVDVELFQNRSADSTDILHEYFVPRRHAANFVEAMRRIIPKHHGDLLNVTIRSVNEDHDTFLRYADQPMLAFVLLFVQDTNEDAAEAEMQRLARELIDFVIDHEGRYYLPYRLHASSEQFKAAYPQSQVFFERKLAYDPDELFQNQFYLTYGKRSDTEAQ